MMHSSIAYAQTLHMPLSTPFCIQDKDMQWQGTAMTNEMEVLMFAVSNEFLPFVVSVEWHSASLVTVCLGSAPLQDCLVV